MTYSNPMSFRYGMSLGYYFCTYLPLYVPTILMRKGTLFEPWIGLVTKYLLCIRFTFLIHWGRVTHVCVGNLNITRSDNGLAPGRQQAIIWTNAGILLTGPLETDFSEILIYIQAFSFKKILLKISSAKLRPFCLDLNVLTKDNLLVCFGLSNWFSLWCRGCTTCLPGGAHF